jgi:hypothetical protein
MPELDKFRIQSICQLLDQNCLSQDQEKAALEVLQDKCTIYGQGCLKRGRVQEARDYEKLVDGYRKIRKE